jgi:hypothetical protein
MHLTDRLKSRGSRQGMHLEAPPAHPGPTTAPAPEAVEQVPPAGMRYSDADRALMIDLPHPSGRCGPAHLVPCATCGATLRVGAFDRLANIAVMGCWLPVHLLPPRHQP